MNELPKYSITDIIMSATDELILQDQDRFEELSAYINELILHDFERLVSLLYRIDVDEKKLQLLLAKLPKNNAADTIATLIIERQLQKIKSRKAFGKEETGGSEEEKW